VFSASSIVMRNLDRIVVLRFLGTQALGYYGLSVNVLTLLMAIPDSFAYVSYPILVKRFTEASNDPDAIRARVERLVRGVSVGLPLAAGLCALGAGDLVHALLPRYDACVAPLRVLAFGATGLSLSAFASIVLMTVGRRIILVPSAVFLTAMSGGLQLLSLRWNGGLVGIAAASAVAYLVSGGVLLSFAAAGLGYALPRIVALVLRCLTPTALAILLASGAGWAFLRDVGPFTLETFLRLLGAWAAFAAVYLLCVSPFARGIGFRSLATEFKVPFVGRRPPPPGSVS
jgi:O-antigen/teichoic acid export membrane protein